MGDGPDDLKEWALKDSDEQARVNLEGTYGKPVIHRGDCQGRYKKMPEWASPISDADVEMFSAGELARQRLGLERTIEFCGRCTSERVN